jgi:hypothetical protein
VHQLDERRLELREQARQQSITTGTHESAVLEALLIQEAGVRGKGDPELALSIYDLEQEMIQQDETREAIDKITAFIKEAEEEYTADPVAYMKNVTAAFPGVLPEA